MEKRLHTLKILINPYNSIPYSQPYTFKSIRFKAYIKNLITYIKLLP